MKPDILGTIYEQTGTDSEDEPIFDALEGFHVNLPEEVPEVSDYKMDPQPDTPHRVYAGRTPVTYKFPDEATFREFYDPDNEDTSTAIEEWDLKKDRTVEQRKAYLREQVPGQYDATLRNGFDDGSGVVWSATSDARDRILELTQRIQEYRAGKVATELPNGKSTVRLFDVDGVARDVGADKIVALTEQGDDFKDNARERRDELYASIAAAASHGDLDAISIEELTVEAGE